MGAAPASHPATQSRSQPRSNTLPRAPSPSGRSSAGRAGGEREAAAHRSLQLGRIRSPPSPKSLLAPPVQQLWERPAPPPAHLQVPLCWARQPRERGKRTVVWAASEVFNKAHRWPPSEPPPASARRAAPLGPARPGVGAAQPSSSEALLPPKTQPSPRLAKPGHPWKQGAPGSRHLSLQARTCNSPLCTPMPGALGQRAGLGSTQHGMGEARGPPAPAEAGPTTELPRGKAKKAGEAVVGAGQLTRGDPSAADASQPHP